MTQAQRELPVSTATAAAQAAAVEVMPSGVRAEYRRLSLFMAATDAIGALVALLLAYLIRFGNVPIPGEFVLVIAFAPFLWAGVFHAFRLYAVQYLSAVEEFRRVVAAIGVAMTLIVAGSFWAHEQISRLWLGLTWLIGTILVLLIRRGWRRAMSRMREDGRLAYRTLIVGSNDEAERLHQTLLLPELGFRPIGFVAADSSKGNPLAKGNGNGKAHAGTLGTVDELERVVADTAADCVFVASSALTTEGMRVLIRAARRTGAEVRVSSNLPEVLATRLTMQPVGDIMAMSMRPVRLTGGQAAVKRVFDVVVASLALVLTLPIWLGAAIAIKLTSRGPVLFKQERVGRHGRPFTLMKFRSMVADAEDQLSDLLERLADERMLKLQNDPRVTRVGAWIRRRSIDELPQLLNVIKGEMSLVGPRPASADEVSHYDDWHLNRLEVRPGISGLWQVNGRSELPFDEYVRLDLFYIENWSLAYDMYIVLKTIPAVLTGKGSV